MQEADGLLAEYAQQLLAPLRLSPGASSVGGLLALSAPQRRLALRQLIQEQGLPLPAEKVLAQIEGDVLLAAADATPLLRWAGGECRRYRDGLYFLAPLPAIPESWECEWQGEPLTLPDGRRLRAGGWPWLGQRVVVRFRQGGEKIRLAGHPQHQLLKNLMQEAGIPPWQRGRLPLVFLGQELMAVVGWWQAGAVPELVLEADSGRTAPPAL
jgi:tRNA(Ile)-lysidine synthase